MAYYLVYDNTQSHPTQTAYRVVIGWGACDTEDIVDQAVEVGEVSVTVAALIDDLIPDDDDDADPTLYYNPVTAQILLGTEVLGIDDPPRYQKGNTNLVAGSNFENAARNPWDLAAGLATLSTTYAQSGTQSLRLASGSGTRRYPLYGLLDVEPGERYFFKFWALATAAYNGGANARIRVTDRTGNQVLRSFWFDIAAVPGTTTWVPISGAWLVPAGHTAVRVEITADHTAGVVYLDHIVIRRRSSPDDIDDDAVTTPKLAPGAVDYDKLGIGAVRGNRLQQNAVNIAHLATGLQPVEIVGALPTTGNYSGRIVYLTTDSKLYRWTPGVGWRKDVDGADLVTGTVSAAAIGAQQIAARHLVVGDFQNLNRDTDFTDLAAWSLSTGSSGSIDQINSGNATSWGSTRVFRLQGVGSEYVVASFRTPFDVDPDGEHLYMQYKARIVGGTGTVYVQVKLHALADLSDTPIYRSIGTVTSTTRTAMSGSTTIPAGYRYGVIQVVKGNNGVTSAYVGGLTLRRKAKGTLVVDGEILAGHINTASFSTAGLSVFGGAVQSDNYVAGVSGWRIGGAGNAEFNRLIVRSHFAEDSVSRTGYSSEYHGNVAPAGASPFTSSWVNPFSAAVGVSPSPGGMPIIWTGYVACRSRGNAGDNFDITFEAQEYDPNVQTWGPIQDRGTLAVPISVTASRWMTLGGIMLHGQGWGNIRLRAKYTFTNAGAAILHTTGFVFQQVTT